MVLPIVVLVLAVLWVRHGAGRSPGDRPEPPDVSVVTLVEGWLGEAAPTPGARLEVRLVPLHGDEDRQVFDRDVLAARLGRSSGQPWQLELRYPCAADAGAPSLSLEALELRDANGSALLPVVGRAPSPVGEGAADPLLSLLAPPTELAPNTSVTVVLWGEAPGEGARLAIDAIEVPLRVERVASDSVPRTLARLERGGDR